MKYAGWPKHISYCFIRKESSFSQVAIHKGFHEGRLTLSSTPLLQIKKLSLYFESLDRRTLHEPRGLDIFSLLFYTTLHNVINYLKIWKQESFVCSSSENGNMSTNMMACKNVYTHTHTHTRPHLKHLLPTRKWWQGCWNHTSSPSQPHELCPSPTKLFLLSDCCLFISISCMYSGCMHPPNSRFSVVNGKWNTQTIF